MNPLDPKIQERFLNTAPATYGHFLGVSFMAPAIKPINKFSKLAGPAYTVKILGKDSAALYKAMQEAPAGSVLVIDRCGDTVFAAVGEMVARNARQRKFAGIVIDGMATDRLAIEEMAYPVFCSGISVATTNVWGISGEYNVPISCGGATVNPGDLILGDADGVVVIANDNYLELLARAEAIEQREVLMRERFANGEDLLLDVRPLLEADVPEYIKTYLEKGRK